MILPDWRIRELAGGGMIKPFVSESTSAEIFYDRRVESLLGSFELTEELDVFRKPVISYGLSSFGYDLRCADEWKIFTNVNSTVVDPKNFDDRSFVDIKANEIIIPPNSFALARSLEYMKIPDNVMVVALGKSTYARCGIVANVTPLEPGWEGHVTLEFSNTTPLPAKMYAFEGCVQLLFFEGERPEVTYSDRKGKYQGQTGITVAKV